jgi:hypothetical protein
VASNADYGKAICAAHLATSHTSYGRGAGVGRSLGVGIDLGVGGGLAVAVAVGVAVAVAVGLGGGAVGVAVEGGVGVGVAVAVAVGVGVGVAAPDCSQYLPPVFKAKGYPPQTIISLPVHTAVYQTRPAGALLVLVAVQRSVSGSYLPPVLK